MYTKCEEFLETRLWFRTVILATLPVTESDTGRFLPSLYEACMYPASFQWMESWISSTSWLIIVCIDMKNTSFSALSHSYATDVKPLLFLSNSEVPGHIRLLYFNVIIPTTIRPWPPTFFCPKFCPLNYMASPKERLHNFLHFRRVCSVSILKLGPIKEAHHTQKKRENQIEGPPPARPLAHLLAKKTN